MFPEVRDRQLLHRDFPAIQPSEIPHEILLGIPLELSLEIYLEMRFEIPLEISLEIFLKYLLEYLSNYLLKSEVGGENRRFPNRESKPSTQHPHRTHRTHDTTDQWREILWWLSRTGGFGLLWVRRCRVSSEHGNVFQTIMNCFLNHLVESTESQWISMFESRSKNKGFVKVTFRSVLFSSEILTFCIIAMQFFHGRINLSSESPLCVIS